MPGGSSQLASRLDPVAEASSKANDAAILADVVMIKEELERVREQVENIE